MRILSSDELKRKIRKLKRLEKIIRFQGKDGTGGPLVWDSFFDLRALPASRAKYTLNALASMNREEYRFVIDEYFARVYYEFYEENGLSTIRTYDPNGYISDVNVRRQAT